MDEFLGFPRRERVKPGRSADADKRHFWLLFVPAKSDWCAVEEGKESENVWRIIQNHSSNQPKRHRGINDLEPMPQRIILKTKY